MTIAFKVNGKDVVVDVAPMRRLSEVLRRDLGLTGTKVCCGAGDCGSCTVLIDGTAVCSCMVPAARAAGRSLTTVEGLAGGGLQRAFHHYGAAQCGICTPGMVVAAAALLAGNPTPTEDQVVTALGGVLCRCTGYRKIVRAVLDAHRFDGGPAEPAAAEPAPGGAVGARVPRVDGLAKIAGAEVYSADAIPADALWLRIVRSPHAHADFTIGDTAALAEDCPGLVRVFTAPDIPGARRFGAIVGFHDQPVLAEGTVRYRGEAVAVAVFETAPAAEAFEVADFPVRWRPLAPLETMEQALDDGAPLLHADRPGNVLATGLVHKGDPEAAFDGAGVVVEGEFETPFIEHAYLEPEAGFARRLGNRIEVFAGTQAPYLNRDGIAAILGIEPRDVRVVPVTCGGGFGGKLDLSIQPYLALAAWLLERPVAGVYSRPESMASTTKRHPSRIRVRIAADADGRLRAIDLSGDFNTGAYASWGPAVTRRVPVHASGPYFYPAVRVRSRAVLTHNPPSGAFRGFGVPQAAFAQETLFDEMADKLGIDRLEFRHLNALRPGQATATGQVLEDSLGMVACIEALREKWRRARQAAARHNGDSPGHLRRGVGVACLWYGFGNTASANPSTIRVTLKADGTLVLFQGAVDIGQGSDTVITQICADALGLAMSDLSLVRGDTDLTADAGKTSASRQTYVSGRAAQLAGVALRGEILRLANAGDDATLALEGTALRVGVGGGEAAREIDLATLPADAEGVVLSGEGTFDPPTSPLDENGQGVPYSCYGFAAQMAEVEVDMELGSVKVLAVTAAHDLGRSVNPILVEGQVEGGVAQGIGYALMEEYLPGLSDNLHDYLIPTVGDVPAIETIVVEEANPLGPFGAKGIGEPALIPTAPAILGAVREASGVSIRRLPATPDRVRQAILAAQGGDR